jgi:PEP-CTERM motif
MRLGRVCGSVILVTLSLLIPFRGSADATPFTILPNGDLEIDTAFTTQGVLTCLIPGCTGSGTNSVTLGSGTNIASVTFFGVSTTFPIIAAVATGVPVGEFVTSASSGFTFPVLPNDPNHSLLAFRIMIDQSSPATGAGSKTWLFGLGSLGGTNLPLVNAEDGTSLSFPIGSQPPGFHYSELIYSFQIIPFGLPSNGVTELDAKIGAVPEPTTLLLFGTTMAGLGLAAWRKLRDT